MRPGRSGPEGLSPASSAAARVQGPPSSRSSSGPRKNFPKHLVENYVIEGLLGQGAFSTVWRAVHRATGQVRAVKKIDTSDLSPPKIAHEIALMRMLRHENVVRCYDVFLEAQYVSIVVDMFNGGDLVDGLNAYRRVHGRVPNAQLAHLARQMIAAVAHVHSLQICHRDVKGENFLSDRPDIGDPQCKVALADFGTAIRVGPGERLVQRVGTPAFWAPEVFGDGYDFLVDIWAVGVTTFILLTGALPFDGEVQICSSGGPAGFEFLATPRGGLRAASGTPPFAVPYYSTKLCHAVWPVQCKKRALAKLYPDAVVPATFTPGAFEPPSSQEVSEKATVVLKVMLTGLSGKTGQGKHGSLTSVKCKRSQLLLLTLNAVEHRAITIQQLRDLRLFLQRLCKVGFLKRQDGSLIHWFHINMYEICNLVLKPVISFVEEQRGSRGKFSWVEFVSRDEQKPYLLFSHSWSGRFRDFMAAVDDLARGKSLTVTVPVWIWVFANNQFGQNFGTGFRDSPFYKAVEVAEEGTLLIVDRDASSLQRIWCGFELLLAIDLQKPLVVYTSAGQVGVSATSGRLVEAVEDFDITQMEASQESDRRQIINFLCGGELLEKKGLKTAQDGNFQLVNGWQKQLSDVTTTPAAPRRQNGKLEYVQEAELFKLHSAKFQKLNATVRDKVLSAAHVAEGERQTAGIKIPRLEDRGVTLGEMRAFFKKAKSWSSEEGHSWETLSISEISRTFIKKLIAGKDTSLAELWSSGPRKPQIVVNETLASPLSEFAAALEWFAEASRLQDNVVFYFAPLCINLCDQEHDNPDLARTIRNLIQNCEGWLSVLPDSEEQIVRSYRLEQLHLCFHAGKKIYFGCSDGVLACTSPFQHGIWEFGHFHPQLAQTLVQSSWSQARCAEDEVRDRVNQLILQSRGGYDSFDARGRWARAARRRAPGGTSGCEGDLQRRRPPRLLDQQRCSQGVPG
ncbi:unnamed protein product [Polarella glacialis]|uniref:Protein kinase domain-containing protein n=1 Tax=Polarella glacialis TaxID=89957 RepID=A0A813FSQ7_POLGL|nr:unnamed protein product [Polarella glacialis]